MPRSRKPRRRNPVARVLAQTLYRSRTVKAGKGRGAYSRKGRQAKEVG